MVHAREEKGHSEIANERKSNELRLKLRGVDLI